ncbi:putative 2-aminoethylphosphonate ABC transporter ATP-binding protein [Agrobacterium salinitolerans]|uniref:putative 2-aminoethylphosphonate ABC transporter ATP-binding protein n=1 Tax=Agrobacterium salinitolerans TaxID=1183413 RepID=UPI00098EF362|nr:putative 2-aminoethylphosphonate ABC transporter ATP-binding protein [Agrobacterium salinitolerans]OOO17988.1 ABC transporter ATP-binding protein [Agrobacterium salinitolerans]PNQ21248.1 putative 2-aminoethylphosphonate ABC transporter ATP-binding protein [Rhizobium sp. YIC5082]
MRHALAVEPTHTSVQRPVLEGDSLRPEYLEVAGLWKQYDDFVALRDISLLIRQGEFVCFLGPSGCGKTTLLRAIAGLDLQSRGSIVQAGKDISTLPASKRDYGIVFQSYALFPNLTIEKNISFGLENAGRRPAEIAARVSELLSLVGLSSQAKKYPSQLSGGQQQRIALARAIAVSPGLLLLDEPLSALDAKVRVHLRHEIKSLQRKLGVTTIMVTHDQEEALAMADRIVVMNHGVIEQIGTPTEIYRHPKSLFVADFIGETNQFEARVATIGSIEIGRSEFSCDASQMAIGTQITAVVRPVDIIPHGADAHAANAADRPVTPQNLIDAQVLDMEFLGMFWRTRLTAPRLGETILVADFSVNAVRRLRIEVGGAIQVEIPRDRLLLYPKGT